MDVASNASLYRLETLGTVALKSLSTRAIPVDQRQQRRRLALLAILAASGTLGRSRDQLLLLLWPESTEKKARHSLDQLLYAIRSSLGDAVFAGVNPLRLNPALITADVSEFEQCLDRHHFAAAVEQYRGPFLDGFYLSEAKEFEEWTERERRRLANRYTTALEHLAQEAERDQDYARAMGWRQKLVDADPLSTRYAIAMARALAMAGDTAAAVAFADRYVREATRELGAANVPDLKKIINEFGERPPDFISASTPLVSVRSPLAPADSGTLDARQVPNPRRRTPSRAITLSMVVPAVAVLLAIAAWRTVVRPTNAAGSLARSPSVAAHAIPAALAEVRRGTQNMEAYELFVRGHDPVLLRGDSGARAGLEHFLRAVELDPKFAQAYAGLSEMYTRQALAIKPMLAHAELKTRAENAARTAIALNDSLAEGHAALGLVYLHWLIDLHVAERELQRAIALDPTVKHARDYLAMTHVLMGRTTDAIEDARADVAANPLSPTARATLGQMLYVAGQCEEALPMLDSMSTMRQPPLRVAITRSLCFIEQRRWTEADGAVRPLAKSGDVHALGVLGLALGRQGRTEDAREIREAIRNLRPSTAAAYYSTALVSFGLGDMDDAVANLDTAAVIGSFSYIVLGPMFSVLQQEPRLRATMSKRGVGFGTK